MQGGPFAIQFEIGILHRWLSRRNSDCYHREVPYWSEFTGIKLTSSYLADEFPRSQSMLSVRSSSRKKRIQQPVTAVPRLFLRRRHPSVNHISYIHVPPLLTSPIHRTSRNVSRITWMLSYSKPPTLVCIENPAWKSGVVCRILDACRWWISRKPMGIDFIELSS